ncbi:hypothetical protein [Streptomyces microflavus]|uniref:hypothetical protein n=1 Tax=Streptomyces microflavus TaxID=1919 RepID=UPI0037FACEF0
MDDALGTLPAPVGLLFVPPFLEDLLDHAEPFGALGPLLFVPLLPQGLPGPLPPLAMLPAAASCATSQRRNGVSWYREFGSKLWHSGSS